MDDNSSSIKLGSYWLRLVMTHPIRILRSLRIWNKIKFGQI